LKAYIRYSFASLLIGLITCVLKTYSSLR